MRKLLLILFAFLPMMVQAQKISRPETIRSTEFGTQKMMVVDSTFVLVIKTGYKPISVELGTKEKALKILRFLYTADVRSGDISCARFRLRYFKGRRKAGKYKSYKVPTEMTKTAQN